MTTKGKRWFLESSNGIFGINGKGKIIFDSYNISKFKCGGKPMDILQQEKEKTLKMQTFPVVVNVGRTLSELFNREVEIKLRNDGNISLPGTYSRRPDFEKYGKITVYIPKIALEFTSEEITAFAAAEYFFMAASSSSKEYLRYTFKEGLVLFFVLLLPLAAISFLYFTTPAPVTLSSFINYNFVEISFFNLFDLILAFILLPVLIPYIQFTQLKTSGCEEEIYQADKKAAELLGTPYNLINALEKILHSRTENRGRYNSLFKKRIKKLVNNE
jgi:hypothetical protein